MKSIIVVTGGSGFVGSNLIELLIKKTKFKIISLDDYSTGVRKNHIKSKRVKYLKGSTLDINKILLKYKKKKLFQFFILENFLEFFKVLRNFMNVMILIQSAVKKFLSFV